MEARGFNGLEVQTRYVRCGMLEEEIGAVGGSLGAWVAYLSDGVPS